MMRALPDWFLVLLVFGLAVAASAPAQGVPKGEQVDPGEFSAERAHTLVRDWAKRPRPSGSASHGAVVDDLEAHLVEVGFDIQRQELTRPRPLTNLIGRAPDDGPAVWVVAHSDSVREAPGAADDGIGLAVLVEAARVLNVDGPAPGFNVLVTDGEEIDLLGARGFVAAAAPRSEPPLMINLEARGTEGPVFMFQTAGADSLVLDRWQASGCSAQATSLARAVYSVLPNDTDFSVFRAAGWWGYDFALIHGAWRYHTKEDRPENLDLRAIQQMGDCVVGLVRAWTGIPHVGASGVAPAYAQLLGATWVMPPWMVRVLAVGLLAATPWPRTPRAALGMLSWLGALLAPGVVGAALLVGLLRWPTFLERPAEMANPEGFYALAFGMGALAIAAPYFLWGRRPGGATVRHGHGAVNIGVAALVALLVPPVGYLLLPGAAASVAMMRRWRALSWVAAALAGLLVGPVLRAVYPALTTRMLPVLCVLPVLLLGWIATAPRPTSPG